METRIADLGKVTVVSIVGQLDTAASADLDAQLAGLLAQQKRDLILDCAGMDYVCSSGLRVFLRCLKATKAAQGRLIVAGLRPVVRKVFDLSGFDSIFTLVDSLPLALEQSDRAR